jgi:ribosomal protein S18 acetylase RimI-like enzyme
MEEPVETIPVIRRATEEDAEALGQLGGMLLRAHYAFDAQRFMAPGDDPESGYAWFLKHQLSDEASAVFVAVDSAGVVGYVYAGIEPQSWKELREEAGFIHDVVVDERYRGRRVATALLEAAIAWCRARGMPRVLLWTAEPNVGAQRLFTRIGFRRTMVEMTLELDTAAAAEGRRN